MSQRNEARGPRGRPAHPWPDADAAGRAGEARAPVVESSDNRSGPPPGVLGVERGAEPFRSPHYRGQFGTDSTGFGHAVIVARDLVAMERFYVAALGFAVSERLDARVGPLRVQGVFLHCNRRHHTLALMSLPSRKRLQHFMLEASSPIDVARAYERARAHGVPMSLGLGQHPDPDGTFSVLRLYAFGHRLRDRRRRGRDRAGGWRALSSGTTSAWGHRPTLGLKLRAASGLIAARLGF
jgi:catechol 2,3-dioxygenase-like lactoylglutathione lyase family enzyme